MHSSYIRRQATPSQRCALFGALARSNIRSLLPPRLDTGVLTRCPFGQPDLQRRDLRFAE